MTEVTVKWQVSCFWSPIRRKNNVETNHVNRHEIIYHHDYTNQGSHLITEKIHKLHAYLNVDFRHILHFALSSWFKYFWKMSGQTGVDLFYKAQKFLNLKCLKLFHKTKIPESEITISASLQQPQLRFYSYHT